MEAVVQAIFPFQSLTKTISVSSKAVTRALKLRLNEVATQERRFNSCDPNWNLHTLEVQMIVEHVKSYNSVKHTVKIWSENDLPAFIDVIGSDLRLAAQALIIKHKASAVEVLDKSGDGVLVYK